MTIIVTPEDIEYTEKILLQENEHFDDERIKFISNFNTLDLQAVPGSGKTTALLAKLLIIEKNLPFEDGSGILVLSHTNTAVEEIEIRIKKYCPKLFNYPNFVGTIQSFVDTFLAIPAAIDFFSIRIKYIDTILFENILTNTFRSIYWKEDFEKPGSWLFNKFKIQGETISHNSNNHINVNDAIESLIYNQIKKIRLRISTNEIIDIAKNETLLDDQNNPKNKGLRFCFESAFFNGVIPFDFAYELATNYIKKYSNVDNILRERFKFIFVDEMQDMVLQQVEILDYIFFISERSNLCYQRIGDMNQAIFGGEEFFEGSYWDTKGRELLKINGTHRLNPIQSKVVEKFGVQNISIKSINSVFSFAPILILFDEKNVEKVLSLFASIVKQLIVENPELERTNYKIKAIGWRKESEKGISLNTYFNNYSSINSIKKKSGVSLWCDLNESLIDSTENLSFKLISKAIWKSLLLILKFENYSKLNLVTSVNSLKENLNNIDTEKYNLIEKNIFEWCFRILNGEIEIVYNEIVVFVKDLFCEIFGIKVNFSNNYISNKEFERVEKNTISENVFKDESTDIEFEVCTVHSVKGETHLSTLYLETYYYNDGGKSYESQRLIKELKGENFTETGKRKKQSSKMVYVGFSRPKYLLCFAANCNNFNDEDLKIMGEIGWKINKELIN